MSDSIGDHAYGPHYLRPPSREDLRQIAEEYHVTFTADDEDFLYGFVVGLVESYRRVSEMTEPKLEVKYPRTPGYRPRPEENRYNAWYWKTSIKGAASGKLAGKRIAVKDNICVAGVPMTGGSALLDGYMPDIDATIITRILDAGGEIAGKAVCEDHSSGLGYNSLTGRVLNPHNPNYATGGSSSGSAALVAAGEVDIAMGADQGGSIRIPSSLCGVYGLKPSHGLVPYTGIMGWDHTIDFTGPIGPNVRDVATLLEAVAGRDELDPRQPSVVPVQAYSQLLSKGARGLKIGVLREGFEHPGASEKVVDDAVREAASAFTKLGADVREISIPMHLDSTHIYNPIFTEGVANHIGRELGIGTGWKGYYNTSLLDAYGRARQAFASNLSDTIKAVIFAGHYTMTRYYGHYYAKAMNLSRLLTDAYNQAFKEVDLLLMPTTPRRANEHIFKSTRAELAASGWWWHFNTCAFDMTGHPAMNVPCGKADGLPIGMELVGRHFEDSVVLRAAQAFESLGVYKGLENANNHRNGARPASRSRRSASRAKSETVSPGASRRRARRR